MKTRLFLSLLVIAVPALGCDSVGGFNPYSVDFKSADDFEQSLELNADQKWKWLRYRRAEIGICFEDEFLNAKGQCELD